MNEEDLEAFMESNKAEIQSKVRDRLIEGLLQNHQWTMRDQISETVSRQPLRSRWSCSHPAEADQIQQFPA